MAGGRSLAQGNRVDSYLRSCEQSWSASPFAAIDGEGFVDKLRTDGIATGLMLPGEVVEQIARHAQGAVCYADRKPALGFRLQDRQLAEDKLGKPILVAQCFNTETESPAIGGLVSDPVLRWIAARYLGSVPVFVGVNLWWTFPVVPTEHDRDLHAHLFHRDVDDFRFFKFFFYLSQVEPGDGAHVCVASSHTRPPVNRLGDPWNLRRYSDREIEHTYSSPQILEMCGPAGTGFAENTLCIHKGLTPTARPRLLLQLQFALFDYGVMNDRRNPGSLRMIV